MGNSYYHPSEFSFYDIACVVLLNLLAVFAAGISVRIVWFLGGIV